MLSFSGRISGKRNRISGRIPVIKKAGYPVQPYVKLFLFPKVILCVHSVRLRRLLQDPDVDVLFVPDMQHSLLYR